MRSILMLAYAICFFSAFMIFFQSLNNAFKKNIFWGGIFLLFPIGSYIYYKKFINEEKGSAIRLTICIVVGTLIFMINKFNLL